MLLGSVHQVLVCGVEHTSPSLVEVPLKLTDGGAPAHFAVLLGEHVDVEIPAAILPEELCRKAAPYARADDGHLGRGQVVLGGLGKSIDVAQLLFLSWGFL